MRSIENNWTFNFNLQSADDVQGGTQETNSTRGSQSEESADITSPKTKTPPPKPVPFRIPSPPPTIKEGGEEEGGEQGREKEGKEEEEGSKSEFLTTDLTVTLLVLAYVCSTCPEVVCLTW